MVVSKQVCDACLGVVFVNGGKGETPYLVKFLVNICNTHRFGFIHFLHVFYYSDDRINALLTVTFSARALFIRYVLLNRVQKSSERTPFLYN